MAFIPRTAVLLAAMLTVRIGLVVLHDGRLVRLHAFTVLLDRFEELFDHMRERVREVEEAGVGVLMFAVSLVHDFSARRWYPLGALARRAWQRGPAIHGNR